MIEVITSKTCPKCIMAKRFLKERDIKFTEIDEDTLSISEISKLNQKSLPIILKDGEIVELRECI